MLDKIVITKENGETVNADFISCFRINIGGREAVYYLTTLNEVDPNGLYKIQASELVNDKLTGINNDNDWTEVKNIMRAIISSSPANFTYIEKKANVNADNEYSRVIAVQLPAKDKMAADYKEKLPQATIDNIISEVKPVEEAPLNTPQVDGGSVVAPGIVEAPVIDTILENPANNDNANTTPVSPILETPTVNPDVSVPNLDGSTIVNPLASETEVKETPVVSEVTGPNPGPVVNSNSFDVATLEKEMESVIAEAQGIFLESAKNLANKIIAEAIEKVKNKVK